MNALRPSTIQARLSVLRHHRFPVWTTGRALLVSAIVVGLCSVVFFVLRASPVVEMELFLAAVFVCLATFLTVGLYSGTRVRRELDFRFKAPQVESGQVGDGMDFTSIPDVGLDADDGCLGIVVAVLLWIVLAFFFVIVLSVVLNGVLWVFTLMLAIVYWLFYRALRQVLIRGRRCRGNLLKSAGYAAFFTFLYTGWLMAVVVGAEWFAAYRMSG